MSDRTRRLICRAMFCVACLVPTVIVFQWIVNPPTAADWELQIKQSLGIATQVGAVSTPLPQQTILEQVQVKTPGLNESLKLGAVTLANTESYHHVEIQNLDIKSRSLSSLLSRVYQQLIEQPIPTRMQRISVRRTQIVTETFDRREIVHELYNVVIDLNPKPDGIEMNLQFRTSKEENADPITVTVIRRNSQFPADEWTIDCRQTAIPVSLVADLLPRAKCLGDHATFKGMIMLDKNGPAWNGLASGTIDQVDLWHLIFTPFNQFVSGNARIDIDHCQINQGKITNLRGTFTCQNGQLGVGFLTALAGSLQLEMPTILPEFHHQVKIEFNSQFKFEFAEGLLALFGDERGILISSPQVMNMTALASNPESRYPIEWLIAALSGYHPPMPPLAAHNLINSLQPYAVPDSTAVSTADDEPKNGEVPRVGHLPNNGELQNRF